MFKIHKLMECLARVRPVFHSEADFQQSLVSCIYKRRPRLIHSEFHPFLPERMALDIWIPDKSIAIELKYRTRKLSLNQGDVSGYDLIQDGETFALRDQAAQDVSRYDFVKDIERLERVVGGFKPARRGFAVFLTNDPSYWNPSRKQNPVDAEFRVHESKAIKDVMRWDNRASDGTKKGRASPIRLKGSYKCKWRDFSSFGGKKYGQFRYLAIEVRSSYP